MGKLKFKHVRHIKGWKEVRLPRKTKKKIKKLVWSSVPDAMK